MKTSEQHTATYYIETVRTPLSAPVKIDTILVERIRAFKRAKDLHRNKQAE